MNKYILAKPFIIGAAATLALSGVGAYAWKENHRPHILEVYIFALKSGRSLFIRTPEDIRILIDGGANSEVVTELTKILPFYSRRIDALIATHTEGKDVSGLIDVLKRYRIGRAYIPRITLDGEGIASSTDHIYETFIETLNDLKVDIQEVGAGDHIDFDAHVSGNVIFPAQTTDFQYSKASAPELVMNISFGSTTISLVGGVSTKIQKYLVTKGALNHSDVLVVSNNGSTSNMSAQCIDAVRPQYFVFSKAVSKSDSSSSNKKILPQRGNQTHKTAVTATTKKLEDPLATILIENRFNIQEKGTVKIISDGKTISIQ